VVTRVSVRILLRPSVFRAPRKPVRLSLLPITPKLKFPGVFTIKDGQMNTALLNGPGLGAGAE